VSTLFKGFFRQPYGCSQTRLASQVDYEVVDAGSWPEAIGVLRQITRPPVIVKGLFSQEF